MTKARFSNYRVMRVTLLAFCLGVLAQGALQGYSLSPTQDPAPLASAPASALDRFHHGDPLLAQFPRPQAPWQQPGALPAWDRSAFPSAQQAPENRVVQIAAFTSQGTFDRTGSGSLIHPFGLLLTNSHVARKATQFEGCEDIPEEREIFPVYIILVTEEDHPDLVPRYVAQYENDEPDLDLAVLRIRWRLTETFVEQFPDLEKLKEANLADLVSAVVEGKASPGQTEELPEGFEIASLELWNSDVLEEAFKRRESVTFMGYPDLRFAEELPRLTITSGTVARPFQPSEDEFAFVDAFAAPGSSGGAVLMKNRLVGVICGGTFDTGGGLAIVRPINLARGLLDRLPVRINQAPLARFTWSPPFPKIGAPITFTAEAQDVDGEIREVVWTFVDGARHFERQASSVSVTFESRRPQITLKVRDDVGAEDETTERDQKFQPDVSERLVCRVRIEGVEEEFASIQAALGNAGPGATILIAGECQENISIGPSLQGLVLQGLPDGDDKPLVLAKVGERPVVEVAADGVQIAGLRIQGGSQGISLFASRGTTLKDLIIERSSGDGLLTENSQEVTVTNAIVEDNLGSGVEALGSSLSLEAVHIQANQDKGVTLDEGSAGELVEVEVIENAGIGVFVRRAKAEIRRGRVAHTRRDLNGEFGQGLVVEEGALVTIAGGRIEGNEGAGVLARTATVEIQRNTVISNNNGNGVQAEDSVQASLVGAMIERNLSSGVLVIGGATVSIATSTIKGNGFRGILVRGSQETHLVVEETTVTQNTLDEIVVADFATAEIRNSTISENKQASGVFIADFASAVIAGNTIVNNAGCGIAASEKATVTGSGNELAGNHPDLCCPVPAILRKPLVEQPARNEVRVPEDTRSLQEAVDMLLPGGKILLAAGEYSEGVLITKDLTLRGAGMDSTIIGSIVSILSEAGDVTIQGVTVRGAAKDGVSLCGSANAQLTEVRLADNQEAGVNVPGSAHLTLEDSRMERNRWGVIVADEGRVDIQNSVIEANGVQRSSSVVSMSRPVEPAHPWVLAARARLRPGQHQQQEEIGPRDKAGILVIDSGQVTVLDSKVVGNAIGMVILDAAQATILGGSEISGNQTFGILVRDADNIEIRGALIRQNGSAGDPAAGIELKDSANAIVLDSNISENAGDGILVMGSNVDITDNIIRANLLCGIYADDRSVVTGSGNVLADNREGDLCGNVPDSLGEGR